MLLQPPSSLFDWLAVQAKAVYSSPEAGPVGTSGDWIVVDSGKSFAWSAKQHGTMQQQVDALEKLIRQQSQQVTSTKKQSPKTKLLTNVLCMYLVPLDALFLVSQSYKFIPAATIPLRLYRTRHHVSHDVPSCDQAQHAVSGVQDGSKASEGIASAQAALDSARPLISEAEQAQQKADTTRRSADDVRRFVTLITFVAYHVCSQIISTSH